MQTKSFFLSVQKVRVPIIVPRSSLLSTSPTSRKGREKWGIHGRWDGGATEPHHRGPRLQSRLGQSRFPGPAIRMR